MHARNFQTVQYTHRPLKIVHGKITISILSSHLLPNFVDGLLVQPQPGLGLLLPGLMLRQPAPYILNDLADPQPALLGLLLSHEQPEARQQLLHSDSVP